MGIVVLTNTVAFADDLGRELLGRGAGSVRPEVAVSAGVLRRHAGVYEGAPGQSLYVRLEDDGYLTVQLPRNVRVRMYAESDSTFFLKRKPWRLRFTGNGDGEAAGVVVDTEGRTRVARRVGDWAPPPDVVAGNAALDLPLTPEQMALYVGTYAVQAGGRTREMRVFVQDGQLMGQPARRAKRLLHQGNHEFRPDGEPGFRFVFTLENGRAEGVTLIQPTRAYSGRRKP